MLSRAKSQTFRKRYIRRDALRATDGGVWEKLHIRRWEQNRPRPKSVQVGGVWLRRRGAQRGRLGGLGGRRGAGWVWFMRPVSGIIEKVKGYSWGLRGGGPDKTKGEGQGEELVNEKRSGRMSHFLGRGELCLDTAGESHAQSLGLFNVSLNKQFKLWRRKMVDNRRATSNETILTQPPLFSGRSVSRL